MSTNYYFKKGKTKCECCNSITDKEYHIGKKSPDWEFSFQGHPDLDIHSFSDYNLFFTENNIEICNEYNEQILWKDLRSIILQSKLLNNTINNKNQTIEVRKNYPNYTSKEYFLDEDGYSFTYIEFS